MEEAELWVQETDYGMLFAAFTQGGKMVDGNL
jgi:hypothetical protein